MNRVYGAVKRTMDIVVSGVGLIITAPVQLLTALAVLVTMGRPVLFLQRRAGKNGEPFHIVKFRTMRNVNSVEPKATDDSRITVVGRFLRSTSLDELPTLVNVFIGDMSLVGPRPLHLRYIERYSELESRRLEVRPGVTGLAQVNGRNAQSWPRRFELDVDYVDSMSLSLDVKILSKTILVAAKREGISPVDTVIMPEFMGSKTPGHS